MPREIVVRELSGDDPETIASWRYPGRYATYDVDDASVLARDHWAVVEDEALIGYCCFHDAARVGGAPAVPGALDVGYGLAPELMGRGIGGRFVAAILEFASARFEARTFRLFILDWNARSLKVAEQAGFVRDSEVDTDEGTFAVMVADPFCRPTGH